MVDCLGGFGIAVGVISCLCCCSSKGSGLHVPSWTPNPEPATSGHKYFQPTRADNKKTEKSEKSEHIIIEYNPQKHTTEV
jgi:hypothetical protein